MDTVSELQAQAGRFLSTADVLAWEHDSHQRCTDLVRAFQSKALDHDGLRAALTSERLGPSPAAPPSGVAVLELTGILMPWPSIFSMLGFGTSVRDFTHQLTAASVDPKIKAVVIVADSPGGSIRLLPEAAEAMRLARSRKPVVVSVAGLCASAAYWIASNATVIDATPSASVGAIGIITERVSIARHLEKEGVDVTVVSAGNSRARDTSRRRWVMPRRKIYRSASMPRTRCSLVMSRPGAMFLRRLFVAVSARADWWRRPPRSPPG